jgi:hypothetical protein
MFSWDSHTLSHNVSVLCNPNILYSNRSFSSYQNSEGNTAVAVINGIYKSVEMIIQRNSMNFKRNDIQKDIKKILKSAGRSWFKEPTDACGSCEHIHLTSLARSQNRLRTSPASFRHQHYCWSFERNQTAAHCLRAVETQYTRTYGSKNKETRSLAPHVYQALQHDSASSRRILLQENNA